MSDTNQLQTRPAPPERGKITMGAGGMELKTLDDAFRFAQAVVASRLAPQGDTAETVLIKLQAGAELGLPPMRALSCLVVVNGRLSMEGVAVLALCRASGKFSTLKVGWQGQGDAMEGFVEFVRGDTGEADRVVFTMADAKRAHLDGKETYKSYPGDMLMWKAVGRFGKRYAADVIMGIDVEEVARDHRPVHVDTVVTAPPQLAPPAELDPIFNQAESDRLDAELVEAERRDGKLL